MDIQRKLTLCLIFNNSFLICHEKEKKTFEQQRLCNCGVIRIPSTQRVPLRITLSPDPHLPQRNRNSRL